VRLDHLRQALDEDVGRVREAVSVTRTASTLSPKESEILRLVSVGLSDQEVSDILGMSKGTLHVHMGRIHDKAAIRSRQRLTVAAYIALGPI